MYDYLINIHLPTPGTNILTPNGGIIHPIERVDKGVPTYKGLAHRLTLHGLELPYRLHQGELIPGLRYAEGLSKATNEPEHIPNLHIGRISHPDLMKRDSHRIMLDTYPLANPGSEEVEALERMAKILKGYRWFMEDGRFRMQFFTEHMFA